MRRHLPLIGLLAVAAVLRFTGVGWGLRHRPQLDERFFVSNTAHMLDRGNLDHGFYLYPGLFYYLLAPVLAFVDDPRQNPQAYVAGRVLVGCFGLLNVALVGAVGRRVWGGTTGLVAAALLAVSPLEVRVAHEVRPDVALHSFVLLGLLAFRGVGEKARRDAVAGAAIGAATAIKFSGALLAPSYLVHRVLAPGPKLRRLAMAGLFSLGTFAVLSPYTFLRGTASVQGMDNQLSFHYVERESERGLLGTMAVYGAILVEALGAPALALAAAGLLLGHKRWRDWLPLLALPLVTLSVISTATITQDRFLIPVLGATLLLAGPALELLAARSAPVLVAVAALAVCVPLMTSVDYVRAIRGPITRDAAADWIESHVPAGRVVTTVNAAIGLDLRRFETLLVGRLNAKTRLQAVNAALVVTGPGADRAALAGLRRLFVAEPETRYSGERIRVYGVPGVLRPRYELVPLSQARLTASEGEARVTAMVDGDPATAWRTVGEQTPGEWIEVELPQPFLLGRIELISPPDAEEAADEIEVFASEGAPRLGRVAALPGRPGIPQQSGTMASQVLLVPEARVLTLRLVQVGRKPKPWGIAELRIEAVVEDQTPDD
jgi:4-amino-4-deoxy-L-arabinose transferase-like glycosyltransferase